MRQPVLLRVCLFCLSVLPLISHAQLPTAPAPQYASLVGYAEDTDEAAIPGAVLTLSWQNGQKHIQLTADDKGFFNIPDLTPALPYTVSVTSEGFSTVTLPPITLAPGQQFELRGIRLKVEINTTVNAVTAEELAIQQVHAEEQQHILGVIPNFYVSYARTQFVPLSPKLKFELATKSLSSPINVVASSFLGGLNQAANAPHYGQGAAAYGERVGAAFAAGGTDILLGGAVFPILFHQDPRYFYQGTGSKTSRTMHALLSPFICKGDNGRRQINFSSVAGDLGSGALANLYYPHDDRGAGLVFTNAAVVTGGRMANALLQEFLFKRLTSHTAQ
jgi:hypothetical protein